MKKSVLVISILLVLILILSSALPVFAKRNGDPYRKYTSYGSGVTGGGGLHIDPDCVGEGRGNINIYGGGAKIFLDKGEVLFAIAGQTIELSFTPYDPSLPTYSAEVTSDKRLELPIARVIVTSFGHTLYYFVPIEGVVMDGSDGSQIVFTGELYGVFFDFDEEGNFNGGGLSGGSRLRCD